MHTDLVTVALVNGSSSVKYANLLIYMQEMSQTGDDSIFANGGCGSTVGVNQWLGGGVSSVGGCECTMCVGLYVLWSLYTILRYMTYNAISCDIT